MRASIIPRVTFSASLLTSCLVALGAVAAAGAFAPEDAAASVRPSDGGRRSDAAAVVSVPTGHAFVATDDGVLSLASTSAPLVVPGQAHIELGIRSEVAVRWNSLSSASVRGKASFSIVTDADAPLDPRMSILFLRSAELELRRGSLSIDLPQGWGIRLGRAVVSVRETPEGSIELVHRGGQAISIQDRLGRRSKREAPTQLRSGQRVLLAPAPRG